MPQARLTLDSESERNVVTYGASDQYNSRHQKRAAQRPTAAHGSSSSHIPISAPTIIDISRAGATKAQWRARAEHAPRQNI